MNFEGGIPISQLPSVEIPENSDVLVLNVSDTLTRKITVKKFLDHVQFKLVKSADWNQTDANSPDYIFNKPCVFECNTYIPNRSYIVYSQNGGPALLETNDCFLINRLGVDYKVKYSSILDSLESDIGSLSKVEVIELINNILSGNNPDGTPNIDENEYLQSGDNISELNNDAGYITTPAGDGDITLTSTSGITLSGPTTHNVNQTGSTSTEIGLDIKSDGGIDIDGNGQIIVDPNWLSGATNSANDVGIGLTAGPGVLVTGPNVTTNQENATDTTFALNVKSDGGIDIDVNGQIIVDPNWLSGATDSANDVGIGLTAGPGVLVTGPNVTTNQSTATDTTFALDLASGGGIVIDNNGQIIVDPSWLDSTKPDPNDVAIGLTAGPGVLVTSSPSTPTTNQSIATDTTFALNVKSDGGIDIDANGQLVVDPDWLTGATNSANNVAVVLTGGDGIAITGDSITTNQENATATTFALDLASGGGLEFDGGKLSIDGSFVPSAMALNDLTDVNASQVNDYILTYSTVNNGWVAAYNPVADTPIQFKTVIDTSTGGDTPPADAVAGDLYIQHRVDLSNTIADTAWTGIGGEAVDEGQYVLYGSDDQWHLGRKNDSLENVQSDWNVTDTNQLSFIRNKPDILALIDGELADTSKVGNGILTIKNSDGSANTTFSANQAGNVEFTLPEGFTGDFGDLENVPAPPVVNDTEIQILQGSTIRGSFTLNQGVDPSNDPYKINLPEPFSGSYNDLADKPATVVPGNGKLTIKNSDGSEAGTFTANQTTDSIVNLPAVFSGNYNDLINPPTIPTVNNGTLTIKNSDGSEAGTFTANQAGTTDVILPAVFSGNYNDLTNKPTPIDAYTKTESDDRYLRKNISLLDDLP